MNSLFSGIAQPKLLHADSLISVCVGGKWTPFPRQTQAQTKSSHQGIQLHSCCMCVIVGGGLAGNQQRCIVTISRSGHVAKAPFRKKRKHSYSATEFWIDPEECLLQRPAGRDAWTRALGLTIRQDQGSRTAIPLWEMYWRRKNIQSLLTWVVLFQQILV